MNLLYNKGENVNNPRCIYCGSDNTNKHKHRKTSSGKSIQYHCKTCFSYFTINDVDNKVEDVLMYDGPRILSVDIETAPIRGSVWRVFKESLGDDQIRREWYMLTWAAKWLNEDYVYSRKLPDFPKYKPNTEDDKELIRDLWDLLDEADIVIAHNAIKFDIPKINTRFLINGYIPPSPYRIVDTLQVARKTFGFSRNSLNFVSTFLGHGQKKDTGGHILWENCLDGDMEAWDIMEEYNIQDVVMLENIYKDMRPWMRNHPNFGVYTSDNSPRCSCGSRNIELMVGKYAYTNLSKFQAYRCMDCGHIMRGRTNLLSNSKRKLLVTNVS